jgi:two-component system response regulator AtoC
MIAPNTQLGPYKILSRLGAGGMGEVYRAKDSRLGRKVAIKVLPQQLAEDPNALARFEREAKVLAAMSHPNILVIYDIGKDQGISYAVMELLEGETLRSHISRSVLPADSAVEIAISIAHGLAAAHSKGVIHRDLKPENVFITSEGLIKILDFGLARLDQPISVENITSAITFASPTQEGVIMGTLDYMSPEQVRGFSLDSRTDIFSFGCMLFEMLSAKRPFSRATPPDTLVSILKDPPIRLDEFCKAIPPKLNSIILRCLEKKPEDRFDSATELCAELKSISESLHDQTTKKPKRTSRKSILLVEDDELFRSAMNDFLSERHNIWPAESAEKALLILEKRIPDVVLLDITLPGMNGIEALKKIKESWPNLPVVMLTAIDKIASVVEAIKLGAFDYLAKPIIVEELQSTLERAIESQELKRELEQRRKLQLIANKEFQFLGSSPAVEKIRKEIQTVAKSDLPVLIHGETGTGKELAAREIHAYSSRASRPFVAINCSALPRDLVESEFFGYKKGAFTGAQANEIGKFQLANHGTLLLDEIGELPPEAQAKLLRVLEEQEFYPVGSTELVKVDVRIISSTNRNLDEMVKQRGFREDLFFRLNVYTISIPPLRERPDDIITLAQHFLQRFTTKFGKNFQGISEAAKQALINYSWKGNVRELRNLIERITLAEDGSLIEEEHLYLIRTAAQPELMDFLKIPDSGVDLEAVEKNLLLQALKMANGNKTKAAKLLNLTPATFTYRLQKYGF